MERLARAAFALLFAEAVALALLVASAQPRMSHPASQTVTVSDRHAETVIVVEGALP